MHAEDPINESILMVSEDQLQGFHAQPFDEIAKRSGQSLDTVIERISAMLEAGVIRRVRQTLMTTNLAPGALVAWKIDEARLTEAFESMTHDDPFTGHVVIRSTDKQTPGSAYRLWTTLKVPQGFSMEAHANYLLKQVDAEAYRLMPAKRVFALGVGHMRRRKIEPGSKSDEPGQAKDTVIASLNDHQWRVLSVMKTELALDEIVSEPWRQRAEQAGLSYDDFLKTAAELQAKGVMGRFSTFLEHVKKVSDSAPVTRYNALFHWRVPAGREIEAGQEVGRFHCMTHAYWREGGPEFANVNIMGVAHGRQKDLVLEHKAAIDAHLAAQGIEVSYTNVFWGGRSEIKPSEVLPDVYESWCHSQGLDPETMRD